MDVRISLIDTPQRARVWTRPRDDNQAASGRASAPTSRCHANRRHVTCRGCRLQRGPRLFRSRSCVRARLRPRIFQLAERASGLAAIGKHEHVSCLAVINKIPLNLRGKKMVGEADYVVCFGSICAWIFLHSVCARARVCVSVFAAEWLRSCLLSIRANTACTNYSAVWWFMNKATAALSHALAVGSHNLFTCTYTYITDIYESVCDHFKGSALKFSSPFFRFCFDLSLTQTGSNLKIKLTILANLILFTSKLNASHGSRWNKMRQVKSPQKLQWKSNALWKCSS